MAELPGMLEHDRKQAGWSVGRAAWELGISIREYRELEAGTKISGLGDLRPDLQAVRLASDVHGRGQTTSRGAKRSPLLSSHPRLG
jgi:hypothetical protein